MNFYFQISIIVFVFCILLVLLTSCSSISKPVVVEMPIATTFQKVTLPPKPELPIKKINSKSTPAEVQKAYVASLMIDEDYIQLLIKNPDVKASDR